MKKILASLALCLFVGACASSTPQGRIAENPDKFEGLPAKHKSLVQEGRIERGMSKDAVYLAWGAPSNRYDGYQNKRHTERWDYVSTRPVYTTGYFGGFGGYPYWGYGYGPYNHPYGYQFAVGPDVIYEPYTRASVSFVGNGVDSWERRR